MDKREIIVSIIVPIYNIREEYLRQCIESLTGQTLRDIEILLIDDGSPDNDGAICEEYARQDERIVVIHQQNQGVSVARNVGLEAARGSYVMFVDPDDWVEPDCCGRILDVAREGQWDIVFFQRDRNDENGRLQISYPPIGSFALDENALRKMQKDGLAGFGASFGFESMGPWCKLYRRALIERLHCRFPVGIRRRQDQIFNLYCLDGLDRAYYCDYVGYHYREHRDSVCRRYNPEIMDVLGAFFREAVRFVQTRHPADGEWEDRLGDLAINMLSDFERIFFYRDKPISYGDYRAYMQTYYEDPVVQKYMGRCRLSDMDTFPRKVRRLLLTNRRLFAYYWLRRIHLKRRGWGAARLEGRSNAEINRKMTGR